ncbi:endolytic transglycosylase MltG [Acuticoccus sp. I52.16.1]|uniref:endolytic transglycosylase MltG n=1 Tax=Acuticoccus sp. I52.16.1 TaxID=2928472 RepID=UPI001FD3ECF9|nr:endolytic transglycosylase MltG [Acuticoccus sp. I52.16.1]UOM33883.1 endolytic transglycosylase MltG [Acuticoccus sp. I52.16.1]
MLKRGPRDPEPPQRPGKRSSRRPEPLVSSKGRRGKRGSREDLPPTKRRSKAARHPLVLLANMVFFVLVAGLALGVGGLVVGQKMFTATGPLEEDVAILIERGSALQFIAQGLEQQGIITNQYVFLAAARATGAAGRMQAGEYLIPAGSSMEEVMERISSGDVIQHQITFAEGLTSAQIVQRMMDNDVLTGPVDAIPPEGSMLPETYRITRGMQRDRLIEAMQAAHDRALERVWAERDPTLPLSSPEELVTLASIVEKETGVASERPRVAAVFVNRLNQDMKLQSDPTILYGLYGGEAWSAGRTLYKSDLERPNPYNTYQIPALPPGPIANPGVEALEATANPADTSDLFFVADGTGGHVFAETYAEHQRNVARWRQIEAERRAAGTGPTE